MSGAVLDVDGPAAPPRRNGELAFDAPWEARVFGLTMALVERGLLEWEAFRTRLVAEIAGWEAGATGEPWSYWARWRAALEALLAEAGLAPRPVVDRRAGEVAARPPGHDHDHHGHGHDHHGHGHHGHGHHGHGRGDS